MNKADVSFGAWYSESGAENDVILSTRVRLARNLVNFPFPAQYKQDDSVKVQSLVFDAFLSTAVEGFQTLPISGLEPMGQNILIERGVIEPQITKTKDAGLVVSSDGKTTCLVNYYDHLRIASFASGCDPNMAYSLAKSIDDKLQETLQFAASVEFGYLTASLNDTGTGMKVSVAVHLPSLGVVDGLEELFKSFSKKSIAVRASYGPGNQTHTINGSAAALGNYYLVSTGTAIPLKEEDQLSLLKDAAEQALEYERKARKTVISKMETSLKDSVFRAYSQVLYCRLMDEREAIDVVSRLKWGCDCGLLQGLSSADFCSLLYRLRSAHLAFVNKSGALNFEPDIKTEEQKVRRLRSLVLQEACEPLTIVQTEK
ncbi:MAG TPA: hypothetical protein VFC68_05030 [Treponemataceae bacterium]|nr:hypothetical protein [Treponemataceae bacterium]